jgi:hypothetical protein
MIPYLLAIAGGYLIAQATKDKKLFAKGGSVDVHPKWELEIEDKDGNVYDWMGYADNGIDAYEKANRENRRYYDKYYGDKVYIIQITDENGNDVKNEYNLNVFSSKKKAFDFRREKRKEGYNEFMMIIGGHWKIPIVKWSKETLKEENYAKGGDIPEIKRCDIIHLDNCKDNAMTYAQIRSGGIKMKDGGVVANTILEQLGGARRLNAMLGAYNFIDLGNGLSFRIKNQKANYIKIELNAKDLYDVEVGRVRGDAYKVVASQNDIYFDQLKPFIEKATGMYLSLFAKGGQVKVGDQVQVKKTYEIGKVVEVDGDDVTIELDDKKQIKHKMDEVAKGKVKYKKFGKVYSFDWKNY